jgi:hypothetical protein
MMPHRADQWFDKLLYRVFWSIGWLIGWVIRFLFDTAVHAVRHWMAQQRNKPRALHLSHQTRFEHMLIVGGSGHGKTQLKWSN